MSEGRGVTWNARYLEESPQGLKEVSLRTKQLSERKIFITGEITEDTANEFVSSMMYLSEEKEPVNIYVHSPGGSVNAGLLIYDVITSCSKKMEINLWCMGHASSMGAVIVAGGPKGHRFILPHSKMMIHEPLIAGGLGGSATSIHKAAESIIETRSITNGILAKHTGKTLEEIDKATAFDNTMNAEEAVAFGLCDEVREDLWE